jgi:G3E family GTPase
VGEIVRRRLESANALVLTKTDLIDALDLMWFGAHRGCRQDACRSATYFCSASLALLLSGLIAVYDQRTGHSSPSSTSASHLPAKLGSFVFESEHRFDRRRLNSAFRSIAPDLVRAKDFVHLRDDPDSEIHVVGNRWQLTPCDGRKVRGTMIVVTGPSRAKNSLPCVR